MLKKLNKTRGVNVESQCYLCLKGPISGDFCQDCLDKIRQHKTEIIKVLKDESDVWDANEKNSEVFSSTREYWDGQKKVVDTFKKVVDTFKKLEQ